MTKTKTYKVTLTEEQTKTGETRVAFKITGRDVAEADTIEVWQHAVLSERLMEDFKGSE